MDEARLEAILNSMATSFTISYYTSYFLVSVAIYVFTALSLYTIAKRRFFFDRCSWLAWVPFAQFWVLGSIADHYQWTVWNREKKKRIVMLVLNIIQLVSIIVIALGLYRIIGTFVKEGITDEESFDRALHYILSEMEDPYYEQAAWARKMYGVLIRNTNLIILCAVVTFATAVTYAVYYYMALYDLYRSCNPDNATVFLVLTILFGITMPIFLMLCRKQDKGLR